MVQNLESRDRPRFKILGHPATSKTAMSAPKCRKMKFDSPLDAPGSGLCSANSKAQNSVLISNLFFGDLSQCVFAFRLGKEKLLEKFEDGKEKLLVFKKR